MSDTKNAYEIITGTNYTERFKKKVRLLRRVYLFLLAVVAVALYFLRFRIPLLPDIFKVDFSAFPELLATFAYGPLYGLAVCCIKTAVHAALVQKSLLSDATTFIVEAIFIVSAGSFYTKKIEAASQRTAEKPGRSFRAKMMLGSSLIGLLPALAIQFLLTQFILYPELGARYAEVYSSELILQKYVSALNNISGHIPSALSGMIPKITHIWQGILLINLPVTLGKLLAMLLMAIVVYSLLLPLLYVKVPKSDYPIDGIV